MRTKTQKLVRIRFVELQQADWTRSIASSPTFSPTLFSSVSMPHGHSGDGRRGIENQELSLFSSESEYKWNIGWQLNPALWASSDLSVFVFCAVAGASE